ncbi:MAG: Nif3-like dinuclear metal center hexameric protein, partial [Gemmatimonas sp.]
MSARLHDIVAALDLELCTSDIPDYPGAVNGLQVGNNGTVHRVAVAVDGSHAAIKAAIVVGADLLVLHHGLFWGGVQPLVGLAYEKYRALITNNVAVYASHLPLDLHAVHGNNALLARALGLEASGGFARFKSVDIGVM